MAIPTVALSLVPNAPSLGPRMSYDDPVGASIARVGGAIADVGSVLGRVAQQKQEQVNRGYLAGEEAVRMQTAAQIQEYALKNPDKPETWSKVEADTWKKYEQGKQKRTKEQGWGPAIVAQDKILTDSYRVETGIRFKTETDKALIRQSNARFESVASMHLASGKVKNALAAVDGMTLYPEQRQKVIEQMTNGHVYGQYDREMSDISTLPPAQQAKELAAIEAELTATNKDGTPVNGWVEAEDGTRIGGLGDNARTNLIRQARARINAANVDMAQAGQALVKQVEFGADPAMVFKQAMEEGRMTEDVARIFVPEVNYVIKKKEEAEAAKASALATRRDKAEDAAERLIEAKSGSLLTMDEIERREARGITRPNDPTGLTPDAANRLRERLRAVEEGDAMTPDFIKINDRLNGRLGDKFLGVWVRDAAQMKPAEKAKVLKDINGAKISVGAKLKLVDKFFEVQKWDLREGEITDRDGDRNIGPEEKELRTAMIDTYRKSGGSMGPRAIGARYMADMQRVSEWFTANEKASPQAKQAKAKEFFQSVRKAVDDEAGTAILRTIPLFQ